MDSVLVDHSQYARRYPDERNRCAGTPRTVYPRPDLDTACTLTYSIILLLLAAANDRYRISGICSLIAGILGVVLSFISSDMVVLSLLLSVPALVVAFVGEYYEFTAHSSVLSGVDSVLPEQWRTLWKWYISLFAVSIGSVLLATLMPIPGILAALVGSVGILVVSILKLVHLYRTAQAFRSCEV